MLCPIGHSTLVAAPWRVLGGVSFGVQVTAWAGFYCVIHHHWSASQVTPHPARRVGYSDDTARAPLVATRRALTRAWVVWDDTAERQPRTCEWMLLWQ